MIYCRHIEFVTRLNNGEPSMLHKTMLFHRTKVILCIVERTLAYHPDEVKQLFLLSEGCYFNRITFHTFHDSLLILVE